MRIVEDGGVCFPGWGICVAVMVGAMAMPRSLSADVFDRYDVVETFSLPAGAGPMTVMPDGRVLTIVDDELFVEDAPGSRVFATLGVLPGADIPSFGAAFVAVSPDQSKVAVGNNGGAAFGDFKVGVFDLDSLTGNWFTAGHSEAEWIDDTNIALTAGDFVDPSVVTALNTESADPANPTNVILIGNIGGASGGITFDAAGNLYTGNGFTFIGPSGTGEIKAFDQASWTSALNGGSALDFEAGGTSVVDILSAFSLGFDVEGNLLVGGGDFGSGSDLDFVAIVRASAVDAALAGMGPVDPNDSAQVRRLDPDTSNDFNFYSVSHNAHTSELYVRDGTSIYVYRDPQASIPTVSEWGMLCMALGLISAAKITFDRRSRSVSAIG